jgi:outer membrane protein assembly factor BamA
LTGCTGFRSVPEGQYLYAGYELDVDSVQFVTNRSESRSELKKLFIGKPNGKFLWMRPYLSLYQMIREPEKQKGFRYWLKYKLGEPPSLLNDINLPEIGSAIENRLQNRGNFNAKADFVVISKRKTAKVKFLISPGKPYTLKSINYPPAKPGISGDINNTQPASLLKMGNVYSLKDFERERARIEMRLKDLGYYYFNARDLLFAADTSVGNRQVDTWLDFKPDMSAEASSAFKFKDIYIFDDYEALDYHPDTTRIGNYLYVSEKHKLKPQTILNLVYLEKDSLYSRTNHYNTLKRLMGIGIFKYASARFFKIDSIPGTLNANVLLTPVRKISLSAEMNASVKSNNYVGPGLNLSYKNRNLFGGAELLDITLAGFFDVQYSGESKGETAYEIVLDASLTLPKTVFFNSGRKTSKGVIASTIFNAAWGIFSRVELYDMATLNASMGYTWKHRQNITHTIYPADVSFTNLVNSSEEFDQFLLDNPTVARSFEEQFILGISYNFVNSRIYFRNRKHSLYLSEQLDLAGNLTSLFMTLINGAPPSSEEPYELLGLVYSQFIKISNEVRYYYAPNKKHQVAWRLIAGFGLPYGNSSTMPYSRQYYTGGTNSNRAFVARSIGPGSYYPADSASDINVDQTGDIKLESSLEYRFGIYRFFKGALFMDAGNVWLVSDDPQRPGGKFDLNTFYKEIGLGSGIGFRFDFNYILIRLDVAFPLFKPYLPEGDRWTFDEVDFGSSSWRNENLIWNIAIGYPF